MHLACTQQRNCRREGTRGTGITHILKLEHHDCSSFVLLTLYAYMLMTSEWKVSNLINLFLCCFYFQLQIRIKTMAGDFRTNFLQICKDNHIQPQESILSYLDGSLGDINKHGSMKTSKLSSTLDLSTCSLSPETCEVLGRVLASDHYYDELKLSDCMIGDEGTCMCSAM